MQDGVLTYNEVETFAYSSIAVSGSVDRCRQAARRTKGGATGVYVRNSEFNVRWWDRGVATSAGQFAADASLTATFGQVQEEGCTGGDNEVWHHPAQHAEHRHRHHRQLHDLENDEEANSWAVNS